MGNVLKKSIQVGGRALTLETGRMAKQASGAVFCTYGKSSPGLLFSVLPTDTHHIDDIAISFNIFRFYIVQQRTTTGNGSGRKRTERRRGLFPADRRL